MSLISNLANMRSEGITVIVLITILFVFSLVLLFYTYLRYKVITGEVNGSFNQTNRFLRYTVNQYADAYERYGAETNTPAIIEEAISSKLGGLLLCERFINNAVSLFVTLGLFGTFLGLSLSVGSLTELIGNSNTEEWLTVLDSVGGGLMSALSGMGVAFYTSLVGVAASILLTVLRSIFSPSAARELMENRIELWLEQSVAPELKVEETPKDDSQLVQQMVGALNEASDSMAKSLQQTTAALQYSLTQFDKSIGTFNGGIHDFSEIEYSLRGSLERLDLSVRDISTVVRTITKRASASERSDSQ